MAILRGKSEVPYGTSFAPKGGSPSSVAVQLSSTLAPRFVPLRATAMAPVSNAISITNPVSSHLRTGDVHDGFESVHQVSSTLPMQFNGRLLVADCLLILMAQRLHMLLA